MHLASGFPVVRFVLCKDSPGVLVHPGAIEGDHRCAMTLGASEAVTLCSLFLLHCTHCLHSCAMAELSGQLVEVESLLTDVGLRD